MKHTSKKTTSSLLKHETTYSPIVTIDSRAIKYMQAIVEVHDEEVGFLGVVDELPRGSKDQLALHVRNIFYPKHSEANGATCEISSEGEALMMEQLCEEGREDDIALTRFWGHSHVNMQTFASGQDEVQLQEKVDKLQTYYIRAICNKKSEMSLTVCDIEKGYQYDHVQWTVVNNGVDEETIIKKISEATRLNIPYGDKIELISDIMESDSEYTDMVDEIEKLKKVNIPTKKHSYAKNNWTGYEQNGGFYGHGQHGDFPGQEDNSDIVSDKEIDTIVGRWYGKEEIGI